MARSTGIRISIHLFVAYKQLIRSLRNIPFHLHHLYSLQHG